MYQMLKACRICGNANLLPILDLGEQVLTGVFPTSKRQSVTRGPLRLVKCMGGEACCGLVQLHESYELSEMYGLNYGYRSGLNAGMVRHLHAKVERIRAMVPLAAGDVVVDIGSNDSTTLQAYPREGPTLVGIDPTGVKFKSHYPDHIRLIPDFFSAAAFRREFPGQKAKVITSFSMFYDLEAPLTFMQQVHDVLHEEGGWVFEQSYLPMMLQSNSYDTVCHEHLEYYALKQIKWMADRIGFTLVDVEFNDVNGGSVSVTARKSGLGISTSPAVQEALDREAAGGYETLALYSAFSDKVAESRRALVEFIRGVRRSGKRVAALGASTKGNVLLQYCGLTSDDIEAVGEVNTEKFGAMTPGSWIPIVPEDDLLSSKPDYLLILPWHFRRHFETSNRFRGHRLVFPLPILEIVER